MFNFLHACNYFRDRLSNKRKNMSNAAPDTDRGGREDDRQSLKWDFFNYS